MTHRAPEPEPRPAISDDNAPLPPARWPTRWTVRRGRAIAFLMLGLALAASLAALYLTYGAAQDSAAQAAAVNQRLTVLEQDLAERTRQRDAERDAAAAQAVRDREQFRGRFCEVLTELAATFPNLEDLRAALHCAQPPATSPPAAAASPPGAPSAATAPTGGQQAAPATPSMSAPASPAPPSTSAPTPPSEPPTEQPGAVCGLLPLIC